MRWSQLLCAVSLGAACSGFTDLGCTDGGTLPGRDAATGDGGGGGSGSGCGCAAAGGAPHLVVATLFVVGCGARRGRGRRPR